MISHHLFPPQARAFTAKGTLKELCHDEVDPMLKAYHTALEAAEKQIRELTGANKEGKTKNKGRYNHMMDVAFEVISSSKKGASTREILSAMETRVAYLKAHPGEVQEAVGLCDSYQIEDASLQGKGGESE